MLHLELVLGQC